MTADCDIRLDWRETYWLITVTCLGNSETYSSRINDDIGAAVVAARVGILQAMKMTSEQPVITARGAGAVMICREALRHGLACRCRHNHGNRG